MRKWAFLLALLAIPAAQAMPPADLKVPDLQEKDFGNERGLKFSQTKTYTDQFNKAVTDGKAACLAALKGKTPGKPTGLAIVSDIDETLVDNREYFRTHKDFEWDDFVKWIDEARAPVLKPTADLLAWARKQGIAIFLITGRPEKCRKSTIENLVHDGVAYDALYLRPDDDKRGAAEVKTEIRKKVEALGFKIVLNIGDQYSDLEGGAAIDCEKLPNELYLVK